MIETVLVATDGSEVAAGAERYGVALAGGLSARIAGLSVVEDRGVGGFRVGGLPVTIALTTTAFTLETGFTSAVYCPLLGSIRTMPGSSAMLSLV